MPFSNHALDKYFVQGLSQLKEADIPDLEGEFQQSDHWINNFILNSIFRVSVRTESKPLVFAILRRAQMALTEYQHGRDALLGYLQDPKRGVSAYFRALYHFEIVAALTYQSYDIARKQVDVRLFNKGDGTPIQRLNRIYNVSKHLEPSSIPEGHLHAVWINERGLAVGDAELSWNELADLVRGIASMAEALSNPEPVQDGEEQDQSEHNDDGD